MGCKLKHGRRERKNIEIWWQNILEAATWKRKDIGYESVKWILTAQNDVQQWI
jgi:hypothetical protein